MEISQGNSLCSYLFLKLAKTLYFSFYLLSFFFFKFGEQEGRTGPAGGGGLAPVGAGKIVGKRDRRMNIWK
jgi:hypothetical protein